MKLPHDKEYLKHLPGGSWGLPPVLFAEGNLGNLLPRSKAVKSNTAFEAPVPKVLVDLAAKVRLQVEARLTGIFISGEAFRS
jgi:hypothetical protein